MASTRNVALLLVAVLLAKTGGAFAQAATSKIWYEIHGWLMWGTFAVLLPLGIFISRFGKRYTRHWVHPHWIVQTLGVLAATAAITIAFVKFKALTSINSSTHVVLGTALYAALVLQFLLAWLRPPLGNTFRAVWFINHFTFGVGVVAIGWYNIYKGMEIYQREQGYRITTLMTLYSVQIAVIGWAYLLLNRWGHVKYQMRPADKMVDSYDGTNGTNGIDGTPAATPGGGPAVGNGVGNNTANGYIGNASTIDGTATPYDDAQSGGRGWGRKAPVSAV